MKNPYEPPKINQDIALNSTENNGLADRGTRLVAGIVDGLIMGSIVWVFILFVMGYKFEDMAKAGIGTHIALSFFGIILFVLIQGNMLNKYGQTIGKRLMKIKIVNLDGSKPIFMNLIVKRYLPVWIVSGIPIVGGFINLVNILFIFKNDRRCIHDLIAGTKVVKI